jgi:hypothetical protein
MRRLVRERLTDTSAVLRGGLPLSHLLLVAGERRKDHVGDPLIDDMHGHFKCRFELQAQTMQRPQDLRSPIERRHRHTCRADG